jgi:hypothetical protein
MVDPSSAFGGGDGETGGEMGLTRPRRDERDHVLFALDESELLQETLDLFAFDRGLEGEVEAVKVLTAGSRDERIAV